MKPRISYVDPAGIKAPDMPAELCARLKKHFSGPELVEIACFIALSMGQQRWLRTLDIEHHQVLPGTDASIAPGFENEESLRRSKADPSYWAANEVESPERQRSERD